MDGVEGTVAVPLEFETLKVTGTKETGMMKVRGRMLRNVTAVMYAGNRKMLIREQCTQPMMPLALVDPILAFKAGAEPWAEGMAGSILMQWSIEGQPNTHQHIIMMTLQ